ncbi:heavy-metal-associated domain-containing protein [Sulfurimonas sp. HSL-3221]|uniref:heavy-metal-associated domain-containing protein n=1 Tax=Sulfurimonadaceae TaxID=2771471 RepID=UPI001E5D049F|nr:heavy-metal-associated domain-containing protein [Sulfurimonas sp. HSL-3221]UFS61352.1 heavy-metal-associated domain-containing protein [Sulfurimonas sp. HSL-3221]
MKESVAVANVRCSGCAATITQALEAEGFTSVEVDLTCEPRIVTVDVADDARSALFKTILRRLGYPLAEEQVSGLDAAGLKAKSFVSCAIGKFSTKSEE